MRMGVYVGDHILYLVPRNRNAARAVRLMPNTNRAMDIGNPGGVEEYIMSSLILSFAVPPKNSEMGFLFGTETVANDVILDGDCVSKHHFSITFNDSTGIPLIYCKSSRGMTVGQEELRKGDYQVIEDNAIIHCGEIMFQAVFPQRGPYQTHYAKRLGQYLGSRIKPCATVTGAYAAPVQPHQRIGPYLELETRDVGNFVDTCLFTNEQTGEIFDVRRYKNSLDIEKMMEQRHTLKHLDHENIVQYIDCTTDKRGNFYVVTEHLPKGSLSTFKPSTPSDIVEILRQCLKGLAYIHDNNFMHRDIRPDNIVLRSTFPIDAKIAGFGLAADGSMANRYAVAAKFWAPEMWRKIGIPDKPVDIWALGLTMLSICDVFPHKEAEALIKSPSEYAHYTYLRAIYEACDRLPPYLAQFTRGMLKVHPDDRWTAHECLEELGEIQVEVSRLPPVNMRAAST